MCPVRPVEPDIEGSPGDEGWEAISEADVLPEPEGKLSDVDELDDETDAEDSSAVQVPRALSSPQQPSKDEVARHNLTHAKLPQLVSALCHGQAEQCGAPIPIP